MKFHKTTNFEVKLYTINLKMFCFDTVIFAQLKWAYLKAMKHTINVTLFTALNAKVLRHTQKTYKHMMCIYI